MGQGRHDEVYYASSKHIGQEAAAAVMDLLDDYWFFHSTLFTTTNILMLQKQHAPSSPSLEKSSRGDSAMATCCSSFVLNQKLDSLTSSTPQLLEYFLPSCSQQHKSSSETAAATPLLLRRMPTLPPRLGEDPTPLHVNSCYTKLRHSMSALDTYQSTTSSSLSSKNSTCNDVTSSGGAAGDRPPRHMITKLEKTESSSSSRYSTIRHYIAREAYYRKTFKKWRSLGDLEFIEIQGLKDLGFVLDKDGRHHIMNATTVPDHIMLDNSETTARRGDNIDAKVMIMSSKAYCAGLAHRSAPPPPTTTMFRWVNRKSADDMKDQLRFWAKAVATNTKLQADGFI